MQMTNNKMNKRKIEIHFQLYKLFRKILTGRWQARTFLAISIRSKITATKFKKDFLLHNNQQQNFMMK